MRIHDTFFIGGKHVPAYSRKRIDVYSPHTEEKIGQAPDASPEDIDRAVESARHAFDEGPWPRMSATERAAGMRRLAQALRDRAEEYADLISMQNGSPKNFTLAGQVLSATATIDRYAAFAEEYPWASDRPSSAGGTVRVRRLPVGVTAAILPWNGPLFIASLKIGPAMAAGSPLVLKTAPETPLDAYLLADAVEEAELPPGVLNIISATREHSDVLLRHPGIDKVSFTGSAAVGRYIAGVCGESMKRFTLELGGKSAAILMEDVELTDSMLDELMGAALANNGQVCASQSRILAPAGRYQEVVDALADRMKAMTVGDPLDEQTDIGPLVAERQRTRVLGYVESGLSEGARLVTGGGRPSSLDKGWYVEPTLFEGVDNGMKIAQEEIFGPVISAISYDGDAEAVEIANSTTYGLCGTVWGADQDRATDIAGQVRAGTMSVNRAVLLDIEAPFGGFKSSGMGRESGPEGIDAYTETQSLVLGL